MRVILAAVMGTAMLSTAAMADERGIASYYTNPYHPGMIAAHKSLPFGTHVRVHNLDNGRTAVVTIVDRGPWGRGRVIDVSTVCARVLGFSVAGLAHVRLERI